MTGDLVTLRAWWDGLPRERRIALRHRGLVPFEWIAEEFPAPAQQAEPSGPSEADRAAWADYEAKYGTHTPEAVKARAAKLEHGSREDRRLRGFLLRVGYPIACDRAGIPP